MTQSNKVARANKTAPMPEAEKGFAIDGMDASGTGHSLPSVGDQGKGSLKTGAEPPK